ncbi:hypothetical protein LR48_Vigan09g177400 [Vigna angularis]|uniref:Uncharacterized protein n=1 Tax=Phaseolus angularis TaxID=3914 RepID=A0A0L9VDH9_PHAAN|nr:hypothetical protein LR48_Vigan09g177400 [Vigna angularis]
MNTLNLLQTQEQSQLFKPGYPRTVLSAQDENNGSLGSILKHVEAIVQHVIQLVMKHVVEPIVEHVVDHVVEPILDLVVEPMVQPIMVQFFMVPSNA